MLEKFLLRRLTQEDFQAVLDLMIRCDMRDLGFADTDDSDLMHEWKNMDMQRDAWLAVDVGGKARGYGAVMDRDTGKRVAVYDDPGAEETDLFLGLLILCEKRAVNMLLEMGDPEKVFISNFVSDSMRYQKEILQEAGYKIRRHIFNMHIRLERDIHVPKLSQGIFIRTADAEKDARAIHALIQESFDWKERAPQPYEDWERMMIRPDIHDETLWYLAVRDDEIIGACLGVPHADLGWIRQLAVREPYRGQGIGRALLQTAFYEFKKRGYPKAGLAVESENQRAHCFYEKAGMYEAVHLDELVKKIPGSQ